MPTVPSLASPYRILRTMVAADDAPWPGVLASAPGGDSVLLVAAEVLPNEWPGWTAAPGGHVLGPVDVVRRADGHDVALPVCAERLSSFLSRRAAIPLSAGELLTLAVSVARGVLELAGTDGACPGTWWLTEGGRPVFAAHEGGEPAVHASADVLSAIIDGAGRMAQPLEELNAAVTDPALLARVLPRIEELLFGFAAPEPLATAVLAPRRVRDLEGRSHEPTPEVAGPLERTRAGQILARHIDADLADLWSRITTGLWRRAHRAPSGRSRRPIVVAVGLAGAILAVGLMWPSGAERPATADAAGHSDTGTDAAVPDDTASPATAPSAPPDLAAVTSDLLSQRTACDGDGECLAAILEDPSAVTAAGAIDLPTDQRTVTLLDDFGGAAVLRVEPVTVGPVAQLVLVIRTDGRWLLRDVQDIAEQP